MRIVRSTATELEILDSGLGARMMGALCVFSGAGVVWLDLLHKEPGAWPALVVLVGAAVFVIFGVVAIVIVGSTRHRFDRANGRVVVRTKSLRGTSETEIPLADIADVVLETSTTYRPRGGSVTTYRVAYVLANGEHVPWTAYLNDTHSDKMLCLYAARAFLRRAAARPAVASDQLVSVRGGPLDTGGRPE